MAAKITLMKFGSKDCGPCKAMAKAKTLEKLAEKLPQIEIKLVDIQLEPPENLDGLDEQAKHNEELAQDYEVTALPTLVFEDEDGDELARHESAVSYAELEKLAEEVIERAERNAKRKSKRA